jgi:hypothetical protein
VALTTFVTLQSKLAMLSQCAAFRLIECDTHNSGVCRQSRDLARNLAGDLERLRIIGVAGISQKGYRKSGRPQSWRIRSGAAPQFPVPT